MKRTHHQEKGLLSNQSFVCILFVFCFWLSGSKMLFICKQGFLRCESPRFDVSSIYLIPLSLSFSSQLRLHA